RHRYGHHRASSDAADAGGSPQLWRILGRIRRVGAGGEARRRDRRRLRQGLETAGEIRPPRLRRHLASAAAAPRRRGDLERDGIASGDGTADPRSGRPRGRVSRMQVAWISLSRRTMHGLRQDLRGALRLLARSPAFAAVVVLTLAVAIGATISVFSVVRGLLLRPLPYREPEKLVRIYASWRQFGHGTISLAEYREDHEHLRSLAGVAAWGYG